MFVIYAMLHIVSSSFHSKNLYIYIGEKEGKKRKLRDYTVYLYKKRKKLLFLYLLYKKRTMIFWCVFVREKEKRVFLREYNSLVTPTIQFYHHSSVSISLFLFFCEI